MRWRQHAPVTLTKLNDDCLLLICSQLSIGDQFAVLQLDARLQQLVLHMWQRRYANEFDWQREAQLKLLSANEQSQLVGHLAGLTRALLNLDAADGALDGWAERQMCLPHMQRLSFRASNATLLRQLPAVCCNIVQLQLGVCLDITPADLCALFGQLTQLSVFELLPSGRNTGGVCGNRKAALADIVYGPTVQTLELPACMVRATAAKIARLPQLRQLKGYLCCSQDIDERKEKAAATAGGVVATATTSACLQALSAADNVVAADVACQIVALNFQCQLDASLPRLLQGYLRVMQLQRFAWHSQLMVHYDALDGSIKWLPQQPQVSRAVIQFIVSQAKSLLELDFTRNVHATPTFLTQLNAQLLLLQNPCQLIVWHDACPRPATTNMQSQTDPTRSDLAFVNFELKHFPHKKVN